MGRFEIIDAVNEGQLKIVKEMILLDRNLVNTADTNDDSILIISILKGYNEIAEHLIDVGADVNFTNYDGITPLMLAAAWDRLEIVQILIKAGADLMANTSSNGSTPLHFAADRGRDEVVRKLISNGADPNQKKNDGWGPLHTAAYFGRLSTVKVLLNGGADPKMKAFDGRTPLDCARIGFNKDVETFLASYEEMKPDLATAVLDGNFIKVKEILESEKNCSFYDDQQRPLLGWAVGKNHNNIISLLLKNGADPNSSATDGTTPLEVASKTGNVIAVKILLEASAKPISKSKSGSTPLTCAASIGNVEIVKLLLSAGAPPDTTGPSQGSALLYAAQAGHYEVVQLLLEHKANPNLQSDSGLTPLMQATRITDFRIVKLLLENGADAVIKDKYNATAFDMARGTSELQSSKKEDFDKIIQLLSKYETYSFSPQKTKEWWKFWK